MTDGEPGNVLERKESRFSISVVVPTHNRAYLLRRCIESLLLQRVEQSFEILIVDDGSTDNTKEIVDSFHEGPAGIPVRYVHHQHGGMVATRLRGIEESSGELIAFMDDDAVASPNWLKELVIAAARPGVGIVGGRVQSQPGPNDQLVARIDSVGELRWSGFDVGGSTESIDFVPGGNMAVWRAALEHAGSFDPHYTGTAWREETDLCVRLKRAGYDIRYAPGAEVRHFAVRWDRGSQLRPRLQFCLSKNNGYFVGKNFGSGSTVMYWLLVEPAAWGLRQAVRTGAVFIVLPVRWLGTAWGLVKGMRARGAGRIRLG